MPLTLNSKYNIELNRSSSPNHFMHLNNNRRFGEHSPPVVLSLRHLTGFTQHSMVNLQPKSQFENFIPELSHESQELDDSVISPSVVSEKNFINLSNHKDSSNLNKKDDLLDMEYTNQKSTPELDLIENQYFQDSSSEITESEKSYFRSGEYFLTIDTFGNLRQWNTENQN